MPKMSQRNIPSTRFAVIREYQPARIERELLVQVFDIAERGCPTAGVAADQDRQVSDGRGRTDGTRPIAADSSNVDGQVRADAPEAVA